MGDTHVSIVPRQAHEPGVPQVVGEEVLRGLGGLSCDPCVQASCGLHAIPGEQEGCLPTVAVLEGQEEVWVLAIHVQGVIEVRMLSC